MLHRQDETALVGEEVTDDIIEETFGKQQKEEVCALSRKDHEFSQNGGFEEISEIEWENAERRASSGIAMGPDDILMQLITLLGPKTKEKLREAVSRIITTGSVPEQWRLGRMSVMYNGKGDKCDTE